MKNTYDTGEPIRTTADKGFAVWRERSSQLHERRGQLPAAWSRAVWEKESRGRSPERRSPEEIGRELVKLGRADGSWGWLDMERERWVCHVIDPNPLYLSHPVWAQSNGPCSSWSLSCVFEKHSAKALCGLRGHVFFYFVVYVYFAECLFPLCRVAQLCENGLVFRIN